MIRALPPMPHIRDHTVTHGAVDRPAPGLRRVTAQNPSPFTFWGTGTYIVGEGTVAVIDPGPNLPDHIEALVAALEGETVDHILITHTHLDHSPAARPLQARVGGTIRGFGPHGGTRHGPTVEAGADHDFAPDVRMAPGETVSGPGWTLEAMHTPGHTSNHLCFVWHETNALFSGDHVMGWATTVVSPPDGDMDAYMRSLGEIRDRDFDTLWPTHGGPVTEVRAYLNALIAHREAREGQILDILAAGPAAIDAMVPRMYADLPAAMHPAAARSVLAHLVRLCGDGRVACDGVPSETASYRVPS